MVLIELAEVDQRQKMAIDRAEKFQGILEELEKEMSTLKNHLKINFVNKMKKMKQRNSDIMSRILKLERIIELNALRSKSFQKNTKALSDCEEKIQKQEVAHQNLKNEFNVVKYDRNKQEIVKASEETKKGLE